MEEITSESRLTPEQEACEVHYAQTTGRNSSNGIYIIRFSFKANVNSAERLTSSAQLAIIRWQKVEKKLELNPELKTQYNAFLKE